MGKVKEAGLRIARGVRLPLDMVGEASAVVATRGAGKSSLAAVIVEETHSAGVPVVVIDWTGVFYGLRSSVAGDGPGLGIYVLGGAHGDVPLEYTAGRFIADLIVDSGHSFVLDLSDFTKGHLQRFCADLFERLYDRKSRQRTTLLVVVDEAHELAPQTPRGGFRGEGARLMGALERVVALGRSRGLGVLLVTQRTQALNKAVLDLIDTLLIMRMNSPRAIAAIKDWLSVKQVDENATVLESLPDLPTGTVWVWAPLRQMLERIPVRRIKTFDSYVSPKPGEVRVEPTARVELDLGALGDQMRTAAERAKDNDPAELRKRIAERERELREARTALEGAATDARVEEVPVEVPVIPVEVRALSGQLRSAAEALHEVTLEAAYGVALDVVQGAQDLDDAIKGVPEREGVPPSRVKREVARTARPPRREAPPATDPAPPPRAAAAASNGELSLGKAHRAILTVLALHPEGRSKRALALQAGYSEGGGGFANPLGALRRVGYVTPAGSDPIVATQEGLDALGPVDPLPTGPALLEYWCGHSELGQAHAAILRTLAEHGEMDKDELAAEAGMLARGEPYASSGGGFANPLGKLRSLGLVAKGQPVRLSPEFAQAIA